MSEPIRNIENKDIPQIKNVLNNIFGDSFYTNITRLGGMTNHTYKITRYDSKEYIVRIPGEGTEEMINRDDERKSTELACSLGIDSDLLYFDSNGIKVMKFISGAHEMTGEIMREQANIKKAASIFSKLHNCGVNTGVRFEVFEMAFDYENLIKKYNIDFYDDYEQVKQTLFDIKASLDSKKVIKRVPCHNDSLIGNWVLDKDNKLYLIDWEYSGMNEPMWDLSCLSIECNYTEDNDDDLLNSYYNRIPTIEERKRFIASKLYVDYLWTLWGLTRIPYDGDFMQKYADDRYARLKRNIVLYNRLNIKGE